MILDGKKYRNELLEIYKKEILDNDLKIKLVIIHVGEDEASNIYIKNKENACKKVGIEVLKYVYEDISEEELITLIDKLNADETVTGIILQSPIPKHLDFDKISERILASKDVDGFTKENVYNLYLNRKSILPCTVKGIIKLVEHYNISFDKKNVTIVGRGNIVGKPLALALMNRNATVTLCHSHTKDLKEHLKNADIVIGATGVPNIIKADMLKKDVILIDVGVTRVDGKIVGDVDFENCQKICKYITPNPGGVGPMTVAMIIDNLIEMYKNNNLI